MSEIRYRWTWTLDASQDQVWKVISEAERIYGLFGLKAHSSPNGGASIRDTLAHAIFEPPAEVPISWVENEGYRTDIQWASGPISRFQMDVSLSEENGQTTVKHEVRVEPSGVMGAAVVPMKIGKGMRNALTQTYEDVKNILDGHTESDDSVTYNGVPPDKASFFEEASQELIADGFRASWVKQLIQILSIEPYGTLSHIDPYQFSKRLEIPRKRGVELLLGAVKVGLMETLWRIRCPKCLKLQLTKTRLHQVGTKATCPKCHVSFRNNLARNVELNFRVSSKVRTPEPEQVGEVVAPSTLPHVLIHQGLRPQEVRELDCLRLPKGRYRIRSLYSKPSSWVTMDLSGSSKGELSVEVSGDELTVHFTPNSDRHHLRTGNRSDRPDSIFVECLGWKGSILTAARAFCIQSFHNVCRDERLSSGQKLPIDTVNLLRVEIVGHVDLFTRQGDDKAFIFLQEFRQFIEQVIDHHDGAVYSCTPGALMITFASASKALQAALAVAEESDTFNATLPEAERFSVRIGCHQGPCFVASLDPYLSYFGSVVNECTELPSLVSSKEIVITDAIYNDKAAKNVIERFTGRVEAFCPSDSWNDSISVYKVYPNQT